MREIVEDAVSLSLAHCSHSGIKRWPGSLPSFLTLAMPLSKPGVLLHEILKQKDSLIFSTEKKKPLEILFISRRPVTRCYRIAVQIPFKRKQKGENVYDQGSKPVTRTKNL